MSLSERKMLDGWDLGILIVVYRENNIGIKPVLSKINSELISEVGWLQMKDLENRLAKLEKLGLLEKEVNPFFGGDETTWSITDKAREEFKGLEVK